jgi:hypothetical protein
VPGCRAGDRTGRRAAGHDDATARATAAAEARLLTIIHNAPRLSPPVSLDAVRGRRQRRTRLLLAAAAVVIVALGGATTVLGVRVSHLTGQQQAQAAADATVRSIVADPAARRAVLTNAAGRPAAMLVTSDAGAVVMPLGMVPNAANDQYVAWGLAASGPQALTSFDVTAGSVGPMLLDWPTSANGLTRFAISLEPGRTPPATPSNVIASGSDA